MRCKAWGRVGERIRSAVRVSLALAAALASAAPLTSMAEPRTLLEVLPAVLERAYTVGGESSCLECHDESEEHPVLSILKTAHAVKADQRTPFANHACESCHGPSAAHAEDSDHFTDVPFGPRVPAEAQNAVCLNCHQGNPAMHWMGAPHEAAGLTCVTCHTLHVGEEAGGDPILRKNLDRKRANSTQSQLCFQCHTDKRAESFKISAHPLRYGQMNCSDCHNPHGSTGPKQLVKHTLNETCYSCHAEKRGPFLWEHAPAREDCSICHTPHGSNHQALLKARGPWLCQECHMADFHPSTAYSGSDLFPAAGSNSSKLQGSDCLNCHREVHGSNHPSGVRWTR